MFDKKINVLLAFILLVHSIPASADVFEYKYRAGEKYRIVSEVEEDVYINRAYSHSARLLNRISVETLEAKDGSGLLHGRFQTSERSAGKYSTYELTEDYESLFWRDSRGFYDIDSKYYMPVVRDVPVFPERDICPGDTWSAEASEVHDFRESFRLPQPYEFPVTVSYQYLGKDETGRFDFISIKYSVFHKSGFTGMGREEAIYPVRVTGYSSQILKWDNTAGRPHSYSEEFDLVLDLSTGDSVEYTGKAKAEVVESADMDRDALARDMRESLDSSGFSSVAVEKVDEGVKITIDNIQFQPDSYELMDAELHKIEKIGEILLKNPMQDILITGHTAFAGSEEGRRVLSLQRARAVAEYLLSLGVREEKQIRIQGKGSSEPVADNSNEEGRKKNRRVEITILEN